MATKEVKLATPIAWLGKKVDAITLREPNGQDFFDLGEPRLAVRMRDGGFYFVEQEGAIKAYLERCIVHEARGALLPLLSLADAQAVKDKLLSFFLAAAAKPSSPPSPTSSSS
jgi:hypothetical protein